MTTLKSLLFLIVAPGMVAGYIPLALLRRGTQIETGLLAYLAFPLWLVGRSILLWSFWNQLFLSTKFTKEHEFQLPVRENSWSSWMLLVLPRMSIMFQEVFNDHL